MDLVQFRRRGFHILTSRAIHLFSHTKRGDLILKPDADARHRMIGSMLLSFEDGRKDSKLMGLRRSLCASKKDGSSLVYSPGCKVMMVIHFQRSRVDVVGVCVIVDLEESVLERRHSDCLKREAPHLLDPHPGVGRGILLEFICSKPSTGAATFLLLTLSSMLRRRNKKSTILCNPTHKRAVDLFSRHGYVPVPGVTRRDLYLLRLS